MTNTQEALKMAIESMNEAMWENTKDTGWATLGRDYLEHLRLACIACKEALEQQEQRKTMTKKALQMAIDFLDGSYEAHKVRKACQEALKQTSEYVVNSGGTGTELRKQQEQEPLGTVDELVDECVIHVMKLDRNAKLYTHPVCVSTHAKQLSDDDIWDLYDKSDNDFVLFARAIEAKIRGE